MESEMLQFPKKFVGSCSFDYEPVSIKRAIYRSQNEIVIEFDSENYLYTVNLKSTDGRIFEGQYTAKQGGKIENGNVKAKMYWDETGPLLVGSWSEDGNAKLFIKLTEVERFDDESN